MARSGFCTGDIYNHLYIDSTAVLSDKHTPPTRAKNGQPGALGADQVFVCKPAGFDILSRCPGPAAHNERHCRSRKGCEGVVLKEHCLRDCKEKVGHPPFTYGGSWVP